MSSNKKKRFRPRGFARPPTASPKSEGSNKDSSSQVELELDSGLDAETLKRLQWRDRIALLLLATTFVWSYWPTLKTLVETWNREPDYSHGFLVPPLAIYFLWARRDQAPHRRRRLSWQGLLLIGAAVITRWVSGMIFLDALDGYSMLLWLAGAVWLLYGRSILTWSASSIAFLLFMIPLPYRAERLVSYPLQRIATILSCWTLQCLGQPALSEGNTILLGDHRLEVEEACSGLRIFVSIVALAFAYIILMRRAWWEKLLMLLATLPIALLVNASRIVITSLLLQYVSSAAAAKFSHDLAGWLMIPLAALLFGGVLWYLGRLFEVSERIDMRAVVRQERAS